MRIEPPPSLAWPIETMPDGHRRGRAAARPAGRAARCPTGCASARRPRLGGREDAELGRVGLADEDEARLAEAAGQPACRRRRGQPRSRRKLMPSWCGAPSTAQTRSLTTNGTPRNGPSAGSVGERLLEERVDHRVQLAVERLDALDRGLHQLARTSTSPARTRSAWAVASRCGSIGAASLTRAARYMIGNPTGFWYFAHRSEPSHRAPAEAQGKQGLARQPRGARERPGTHHPDPRARVRRLRQRGREVPRRRHARGRVHRLPAQAGRLRPAPGRRPDDPREAALRRHHAGADGGLRRRGREVRAAQQGPHHHAPEHPAPPHPAARRGQGDPRAVRLRPVEPRGLRQHRPQRDRRPVGRRVRGRALRPDALRRRLRALLRAPPHHAADAAQGQDGLHGDRRGPRDHRHPRRRLHPAHPRRRARASRCASAAAPRSCRASRRRCTSSWRPTTAST